MLMSSFIHKLSEFHQLQICRIILLADLDMWVSYLVKPSEISSEKLLYNTDEHIGGR